MIYFHEVHDLDPRTGYSGAFQQFYSALCRVAPGQFTAHPRNCLRPRVNESIDLDIFFGQPYEHFAEGNFKDRQCSKRGVFTMWEWERINPDLLFGIEKYFDFVIVPTQYCKKIFEQHLPDHPVFVCPLGVNPDMFPLLQRDYAAEPFIFIWQGFVVAPDPAQNRKRVDLVLQAFNELNLPDAILITKGMKKATRFNVPMYLHGHYGDNVSTISDELSQAELISLWQRAHFGIFPSEGEGVGLIPLEMMSTGMPVAIADNTGAAEYCNALVNYPIPSTVREERHGISFTRPSIDDIKEIMLYAYHNRAAIEQRGLQAAAWIRENHTYEHAARQFVDLCGDLMLTEAECSLTLA